MKLIATILLTLLITGNVYGRTPTENKTSGTASWYSTEACRYNTDKSCPTASGKSLYTLEEEEILFCAMWGVDFGRRVKVTNQANGKSTICTVLDRGPAIRLKRLIDLSKRSFEEIADSKIGIINVTVEVI